MDILSFLGFHYRVASIITLYFVVPGINIPKIRSNGWLDHIKNLLLRVKKSTCLKWTYGHADNNWVATLSKPYVTTKGITMQSFKSIGQF